MDIIIYSEDPKVEPKVLKAKGWIYPQYNIRTKGETNCGYKILNNRQYWDFHKKLDEMLEGFRQYNRKNLYKDEYYWSLYKSNIDELEELLNDLKEKNDGKDQNQNH